MTQLLYTALRARPLQVKVGIGNPFSPFRLAAMPKVMLVHAGIHWIFLEKQNSTLALPCQNKKTLDVGCSHLGSRDCVHAPYNSTNCIQENAEGLGVGVPYTFSDAKMSSKITTKSAQSRPNLSFKRPPRSGTAAVFTSQASPVAISAVMLALISSRRAR
jgi:hypothetical protein